MNLTPSAVAQAARAAANQAYNDDLINRVAFCPTCGRGASDPVIRACVAANCGLVGGNAYRRVAV